MRAINLDAAGIGLASLCIIHCMAMPLMVAAMPILSDVLDLPEAFHLGMVLAAVPLSGFGLLQGFGRHGRVLPPILGFAGLGVMIAAVAFASSETGETIMTAAGSVALVLAHLMNWRTHK